MSILRQVLITKGAAMYLHRCAANALGGAELIEKHYVVGNNPSTLLVREESQVQKTCIECRQRVPQLPWMDEDTTAELKDKDCTSKASERTHAVIHQPMHTKARPTGNQMDMFGHEPGTKENTLLLYMMQSSTGLHETHE